MIKTTRAAVLVQQKSPLSIMEITLPDKLDFGQVLVKVIYSGICGSQIGEIDGVKGKDNFLPHLLGHEGYGQVIDIGPGVTKVKKNEKVILHWRKGSGINSATPEYSYKGDTVNAGWVTTFNDHAIISENRLTKVSDKEEALTASLFGCAITTGFGVIDNDAKLKIGESVVIFGSGGIGLNMIQAAKLKGAYPIIAVDIYDERLDLAKKHNADFLINSRIEKDIRRSILNISKDIDVFVDNTGNVDVIELGYDLVNEKGRVVLVGVPKYDEKISINTLPLHFGKKLIGSEGGSTDPSIDIPKYLKLVDQGILDISKQITQVCPLTDINDAISDMKNGVNKGKIIIELNS
tara:strand:+ start:607 stop:1653 length:1047 start_codon:yes stop_codon:yes gene_type:complete